ncbi:hypothetical protein FPV67DRAFT_1763807 [Lyophyllum atratum]|nr:hypothetical protein FPV67DRAFT_1763807 [Lyophyllum atratum]
MSQGSTSTPAELQLERSCFHGTLIATLAYGALLMLYTQLTQVLLSRPKRGRMYWAIVFYSSILFCLATLAVAGMLKYAELTFIDNREYPGGPLAYYSSHLSNHIHTMGQICTTLVPWIGDILMLYRLYVVWNANRLIVIFPALLYVSRVAMSVPLLVSQTKPPTSEWVARIPLYTKAFYSLCVENVMGKLHASFYTGFVTILVESGAFFTIWALTYVILMASGNVAKDTFLLPYTHVLGITRMLIVLRMAQDRAWSPELATAISGGVLDWQVSSTHSIPLHDVPASSAASLPGKYQDSL